MICHTSITDDQIPYMSIPKIQAYRSKLGKNISLKIGMPNIFGGSTPLSPTTTQEESSQEDVESFFGSF
ncbi:MAG TPA: hypothetical protein GX707_09835 [Epulopiscium sp.]|nr:hypothetical protein [Candidatus Epulonipiscium sp.]